MASEEKVRVFVAVELPDTVKAEFAGLAVAIDALGVRGARTVRPEGIHLTLKFLGDVSVERVPEIRDAMDFASDEVAPFDLSLGDAGVFPNPRATRVLWVGVEGDLDSLGRLQQRVEESLAELGFRPERRGFNPHITAGRVRDRVSNADRRRVTETLLSHEYARPPIRVESISLIRSTLHPDGAMYEPIYGVGLGGD
ncbi:MAG: RNA 2',3'-cyclic phosphodiesterase [Dehalococcoidia bacterium]|nr:RNA 2',3'-cyclic phosphodiesterase [Dehalococcoidia bacterium]